MTTLTHYQRHVLPRSFYDRSPVVVARELLGCFVVRVLATHLLVGKIVETEAYLPFDDTASHGYKPMSNRTKTLFGEAGHAYIYGLRHHVLLNAVTQQPGYPGAVLIRALEPIHGLALMQQCRKTTDLYKLTSGPGKIGNAFALSVSMDGKDLTNPNELLFISAAEELVSPETICTSPRIGISSAKEELLRFSIRDTPFISVPVPKSYRSL